MADRGTIKLKFCEALDRFVEIRCFTDDEIEKLFRNIKIKDKRAYKRLIINAAIVNYLDEIAPLIFGDSNYSLFGEITEQELYNLCIKVNPSLDIKKVTITIEENAELRENLVPMLNSGADAMEEDITERLINMEDHLRKRVVGQEEAIIKVSQAIRKAHVGLRNPVKPIGTFLFCGPTGVGKTHLAKVLAEFLFGDEEEIIRIDCSEYSLDHEYAKLIGAPPGYIGHKEGGMLTEAVKNKPRSVVLFDEIEKAHWKVHNLLLQMFDAGHLTDNKGTKISFRNTVIIMTSNVGVKGIQDISGAIGFGDHESKVDQEVKTQEMIKSLKKTFKPEFLNRIDEVVNFNALTRDHNLMIIDIMLSELTPRLDNLKMTLEIPPKVKEFLVDHGTDEKMGARPLRRAIHRFIESPLSEDILRRTFVEGDIILAAIGDDEITFTKKKDGGGPKEDTPGGKGSIPEKGGDGSGDSDEADAGGDEAGSKPEAVEKPKAKKTRKSSRKKSK